MVISTVSAGDSITAAKMNELIADINTNSVKATILSGNVTPSAFGPTQGTRYVNTSGNSLETTETQASMIAGKAGTMKNLRARVDLNTVGSGDILVTVMKNGAATTLVGTIASGSTAIVLDSTHTVSVAATDLISFRISFTGAGGSINYISLSLEIT